MDKLGCRPADLARKEAAETLKAGIGQLDVAVLAKELDVGELLLKDILAQLARPGRDPREDLPAPVFKKGILKLEDLERGMELTGTVLNVVDFGAFVDIGMHDSGLVHVSQLADRFVRDPHDVIAVGDIVKVWVVEVDKERRRVSLTMIPPRPPRPAHRRDDKPSPRRREGRSERPPRGERSRPEARPRGKGPPRRGARGPARPRYKPKSRPKPITPITDDMKAGKEPMRSFSDLAQFFGSDEPKPAKRGKKPKPPRTKDKPQAGKEETPTAKDPQASKPESPTEDVAPPPPKPDEQPPDGQAPTPQAEAPPSQEQAPSTPSADPGAQQEPPTTPSAEQSAQQEPPTASEAERSAQEEPKELPDQGPPSEGQPEATRQDETSTGAEEGAAGDPPEEAL
jgi:uncharacterized protein